MTRRAKTLFLSWVLPGSPTGSAYVTGNLARQFTRDEMVVAGEVGSQHDARGWQACWPALKGIQWERPFARRGLRYWRKLQFPAMVARSLYLAVKNRCDTVLVTYPDEHFLAAGYVISVLTGARLFPYYHNLYVENRRGLDRLAGTILQTAVFRRARSVLVMSEGMARLFAERYPAVRTTVLPHMFVGPDPKSDDRPRFRSPVRLVIAGNVNESCLDAVSRVVRVVRARSDSALLFVSGTPRSVLDAHGLLGERIDHVSPDDQAFRAALRAADILVLPLGLVGVFSADEYRTMFPTRTIEYLLAQRPIVAHVPKHSFLAEYLTERDCALVVSDPDEAKLSRAIDRLVADDALRVRLVEGAGRAALAHRAGIVADELRRVLHGHVGS